MLNCYWLIDFSINQVCKCFPFTEFYYGTLVCLCTYYIDHFSFFYFNFSKYLLIFILGICDLSVSMYMYILCSQRLEENTGFPRNLGIDDWACLCGFWETTTLLSTELSLQTSNHLYKKDKLKSLVNRGRQRTIENIVWNRWT